MICCFFINRFFIMRNVYGLINIVNIVHTTNLLPIRRGPNNIAQGSIFINYVTVLFN